MAHFAKLDENNIVTFVTVGRNDDNELELSIRTGDTYKQTSYNTKAGVHLLGGIPLRKNFAGIGYTYDANRDAFIPTKPFESWLLNENTCNWESPVPYPDDDKRYIWNESITNWEEVTL
jgi:hypothetical protein